MFAHVSVHMKDDASISRQMPSGVLVDAMFGQKSKFVRYIPQPLGEE